MSDEENIQNSPARLNGSEESEEEAQYKCRKCGDGQTFTAAELDNHRARHKAEGAKLGGRQSRKRGNSPSRSEVTLFEEIGQTPPRASSSAKRGRGAPVARRGRGRRSNKTYDSAAIGSVPQLNFFRLIVSFL
ncbi:hypothetical protein Ocin01_10936 [Orchesella cincta]|uniref:Uncharacterized protein n=1 Tax=Orchesella cincta TaxID=48709 RepID=A0A1D2MRM6_ORCCI|nr:hypothetical protein Ocin01_10936 [Orchesella cincta]